MRNSITPFLIIWFLVQGNFFCFAQDYARAKSLMDSGKTKEAMDIFSAVKKGTPDYPQSRYQMGMIAMRSGDLDKAEEYLNHALSANNKVADYHLALAALHGQMVANANPVKQAIYASKIRGHLEQAAALDTRDINSRIFLLGFYSRAPKMMGGDIEKARKTANEIFKIDAAEGNRALAMVAQAEDKQSEAEKFYNRALLLAPDSIKHYNTLASVYQSQSKYNEAFAVYEKAVKKFPANRNVLFQAGRMAYLSGQPNHDAGFKYLNAYVGNSTGRPDRNMANAHYYLGMIEKERKNINAARVHFNNALKVNPEHAQAKQALKDGLVASGTPSGSATRLSMTAPVEKYQR